MQDVIQKKPRQSELHGYLCKYPLQGRGQKEEAIQIETKAIYQQQINCERLADWKLSLEKNDQR